MIIETLPGSGLYTMKRVIRAGKVTGAVSSAVDAAFGLNAYDTEVDESYGEQRDYSEDVATFCTEYMGDRLFDRVPGRAHSGFASFVLRDSTVVEPSRLKAQLVKYSRGLD